MKRNEYIYCPATRPYYKKTQWGEYMHDYYDGLYKYLLNATFWFILLIVVLGIGMFGMLAYRGLKKK